MKICICGSTKFKKEAEEVASYLTLQGHSVYMSNVWRHQDDTKELTEEDIVLLTMVHAQKIIESDRIFVVNKNDYIGTATKAEIKFAEANDKEVSYYCKECSCGNYTHQGYQHSIYLEFYDERPVEKLRTFEAISREVDWEEEFNNRGFPRM